MNLKRIQIGFFGLRNSGKSSIVNRLTNQEMSVVSCVKGTTTDPVRKTMEILPLGPVIIIDTPGIDDEGNLGEKRVETTKKILRNCDIAILITEAAKNLNDKELELISVFKERKIPYLIVKNKVDVINDEYENSDNIIYTSAINNIGIEALKNAIGIIIKQDKSIPLVSDLVKKKDIVVLVIPIDKSSPKDRLILPQQLAIRDLLDKNVTIIINREDELKNTIDLLGDKISLVVTDSQVFNIVKDIVPLYIRLTSFSILMARYNGVLDVSLEGAKQIDKLENGSKILISEGCTHHRQCEDIGTVKLPTLLKKYTDKELIFEWTSGRDFKEHLEGIDLVIHCGGCMLNRNEMKYRMNQVIKEGIPFTNYGIAIGYMNGILNRISF